jgi:hypothetical protein
MSLSPSFLWTLNPKELAAGIPQKDFDALPSGLRYRPVLRLEAIDKRKRRIVGHQRQSKRQRMGGDHQILNAERAANALLFGA